MDVRIRQWLAGILFPRYSKTLDRMNYNALQKEWFLGQDKGRAHISDTKGNPYTSDLFNFLGSTIIKESPIDYFEFGVFEGDTMRKWTSMNAHPQSRFFGFDSFTGLHGDWYKGFPKGSFDTKGATPNIDDSRVQFIKGYFNQTLSDFLAKLKVTSRVVVFVDCDLYESAIYVLTMMNQVLSAGSVLIFDDFADPIGEFKAYLTWSKSYARATEVIGMTVERGIPCQVAFRVI